MKLTNLVIDGFGVWTRLEIRDLDPKLNVFYGPNEAGKTTLLEFIRAVLYGFTAERRSRYLPPVHGGASGGSINLTAGDDALLLRRSDDIESPIGAVTVTLSDGSSGDHKQLEKLLNGVDEPIFQNVFALGLEELQRLATLDGTSAAQLLYGLSAGLDRVSLAEVMQELDASRRRMLCDDRQSRIADLLAERDKLCEEIGRHAESMAEFLRLAGEHDALANEIATAEAEVARLEREARMLALARTLTPKWDERAALAQKLAAIGPLENFPADALARLKRIVRNRQRHRRQMMKIAARRKRLKSDTAALAVRDTLWRLEARIEGLAENESWIVSVERELDVARQAVAQLESRMSTGLGNLAIDSKPASGNPPDLSRRRLSALRAPATELRRAVRAARDAKSRVVQAEESVEAQSHELQAALAAHGVDELSPALEKTGEAVAQWRRRVQIDDRLDRMTRHRADLEDETHATLNRQMLPGWMLASFGGVFVVGVLLVFAGMLLPSSFTGTLGWVLSVLGIVAVGAATAAKWMLERSAARRLESCQKQLAMLESQATQITDERDALDKQLPGGGTPSARLQAAEAELAALEELLPLEARRQSAQQQLPLAEHEAEQAKEKLRAAHKAWQTALAAANLPKTLTLKQVRQLVRKRAGMADLSEQLTASRNQRDRIERELAALASRIAPLFAESGLTPQSQSPSEQLRQLSRALAEEKQRSSQRDAMLAEFKRLGRLGTKSNAAIIRLRKRRQSLLHRCGATDRAELIRRAEEHKALADLVARRNALEHELAAACAGVCELAELTPLVARAHAETQTPNTEPSVASDPAAAARQSLHSLIEGRGRLAREMESLAEDRRLGELQLQLAATEERLTEAVERWQVLCVTLRILQQIKEDYERRGQPETLVAASQHLARLTDSRYGRVWTPLGENVLLVDDASGASLPVELLSRGAREQLFLALRLALVDYFRRRGIEMPLVLDDVLVNFDDVRSVRAAEVLRDFAAAGYQLLVFTCHERLADVFQSLGAAVRRLPPNTEPNQKVDSPEKAPATVAEPQAAEQPAEEPAEQPVEEPPPPRRRRAKQPKAPEPLAESESPIDAASNGSTNGHAEVLVEPEAAPIAEATAAPPRQLRADPAHGVAAAQVVRRRWSAEEFDGELEDRVRSTDSAEE